MLGQALAQVRAWCNASDAHFAHRALHTLAINRSKLRREQHRQLARAIKRMGGYDLVNPMLERHFLRRWRDRLVVQAPSADTEQVGLRTER